MHDYMNFKHMSGNEILINLQNNKYMTTTERLNCMIALKKKDIQNIYPWMEHPWFFECYNRLRDGVHKMSHKHILMTLTMVHKY